MAVDRPSLGGGEGSGLCPLRPPTPHSVAGQPLAVSVATALQATAFGVLLPSAKAKGEGGSSAPAPSTAAPAPAGVRGCGCCTLHVQDSSGPTPPPICTNRYRGSGPPQRGGVGRTTPFPCAKILQPKSPKAPRA